MSETVPDGGEESLREWTIQVPGRRGVDLEADRSWRITASCSGTWAAEAHVEPGTRDPVLTFSLVPAGRLGGRFETAGGRPPEAGELRLRLDSPAPGSDSDRKIVSLSCPLDRGRFDCEVPAGTADARLAVDGFAPAYAWDVRIPPRGTLDLGLLELIEGASVAGWVQVASHRDGEGRLEAPTVSVEPALHGEPRKPERRRFATRGERTTAGQRGFFQLAGLPPGAYRVVASLPGHSPAATPVTLHAGEETLLDQPLEITARGALDVLVEPVVDVAARPWYLRLLAPTDAPGVLREVAAGPATAGGLWSAHDLAAGPLVLRVEDAERSIWEELELELAGDREITVQLAAVGVEGDVRLGSDPVAAEVFFGTTTRAPSVRMASDAEGRFSGVLPAEGEWPLEIALPGRAPQAFDPVAVRRDADGIARVSLRLPDTTLAGEVLDESGEPVAGAIVLVVRAAARAPCAEREAVAEPRVRREANLTADRDGRFELRGLLGGRLEITAYDGSRTAPWQRIDLEDGPPGDPIRLTLRPRQAVSGIVLSPNGPVPGAAVVGFSDGPGLDPFAQDVTSIDGGFTLELTAGTGSLDLLVSPPGYDVAVRRAALGGGPLVIEVGSAGSRLVLQGFRPPAVLSGGGVELPLDTVLSTLFPLGRLDLEDGLLAITGIDPGSYAVCSGQGDGGCASGFLGLGGELVLTSPEPPVRGATE